MQPTGKQENQSGPPSKSENTSGNSERKNSPPLKVVVSPDTRWPSIAEGILIVITVVLAIFNYFTVRYAADQTKAAVDAATVATSSLNLTRTIAEASERESQRMIDVASRNAAAAEKSAIAAQKTADISEKAAKLQSRAWVAVDRIETVPFDSTKDFKPIVIVQNFGPTPAVNAAIVTFVFPVRKDSLHIVMSKLPTNAGLGQETIEPHATPTSAGKSIYLGGNTITRIRFGDQILALQTVITYQDVWREYHREICRYTYAPGNAPPGFISYTSKWDIDAKATKKK